MDKRIINFDDRFILSNNYSLTSLEFPTQPPPIIEYEDQKILDAIWNVIDVCTVSVVKTPDEVLRDVSLDVVTVFLARDSLMVPNELHLYDFLTRYQIK